LDETVGWMYVGGETMCEMDMKQGIKQMVKCPTKRAREK
jgi:hypothetical protein